MSVAVLMAGTTASGSHGVSLWIPPAAGAVAALVVVTTGAWIGFKDSRPAGHRVATWLRSTVNAGPAWTLSDSWATNLAGAGAVVGAFVTTTGTNSVFSGALDAQAIVAVCVLFLIFGGAAALGPVTYGALARTPDDDLGQTLGYVWGFMIAAGVTVLAVMGELATVALLVWQADASTPGKAILVVFTGFGAVLAAIYSSRTVGLFTKIDQPQTDDAGKLLVPRMKRSVLGGAKVSATL